MTKKGFLSAVEERFGSEYLIVRARRQRDLADLKGLSAISRITSTPDSDYPYRLVTTKHAFAVYLAKEALNINYTNFKEAVEDIDQRAAATYHNVWKQLIKLEEVNERIHPYLRPIEISVEPVSSPDQGGELSFERSAGRKRVRVSRRVLDRNKNRKLKPKI